MAEQTKVRAKALGYYNHLRRYPVGSAKPKAGEPFVLENPTHFSEVWMEYVSGPDPRAIAAKARAERSNKKTSADKATELKLAAELVNAEQRIKDALAQIESVKKENEKLLAQLDEATKPKSEKTGPKTGEAAL